MVLTLLYAMLLTPPDSAQAPLDSTAVLGLARALHPAVSAGDCSALWPRFEDRMRAAMKDSASCITIFGGIHAQIGTLDSVLSEEVRSERGLLVYRARCRFATAPEVTRLTISFTPAGRIAGLRVSPGESKPYPSPFLDYQTRTELRLPFEGEWFVFWGGRTLEQNYHAASRSQRFAHDLVIMKQGTTLIGDGRRLEDYYSYGAAVLAPAAGTVVWVEDGLPDQAIGTSDPSHPVGNGVILDHGQGEFSLLAHLQPKSLKVKKGERVRAGQLLGLCGNSGNTSEPHVHYHLQNGPDPENADGLPAAFVGLSVDGQRVERAEIVRGQQVRPAAGRR